MDTTAYNQLTRGWVDSRSEQGVSAAESAAVTPGKTGEPSALKGNRTPFGKSGTEAVNTLYDRRIRLSRNCWSVEKVMCWDGGGGAFSDSTDRFYNSGGGQTVTKSGVWSC